MITRSEAGDVPAGPFPDGASPVGAGRASPVVLELTIAGTEPLTGTVRAAGAGVGDPVAFHGWIDLMAAISALGAGQPACG